MRCFLKSWKNPPINQTQEYIFILHTTDKTIEHGFFSIAASFLFFTPGNMGFLEKSFFPTFSGFVDFYRLVGVLEGFKVR